MINIRVVIIPEPHLAPKFKHYDKLYYKLLEHDFDKIIFPGDVFDRGTSDTEWSNKWICRFKDLEGKIHSAVGNHETSFVSKNPFWDLTCNHKLARGDKDVINLSKRFVYHNVAFTMQGYNEEILAPVPNKTNILVSHNNYSCSTIENTFADRDEVFQEFVSYVQIKENTFKGYDYVFIGHMHMTVGVFTLTYSDYKTTHLQYLASLGRTSKDQHYISTIRKIPVLEFDDVTFNLDFIELDLGDRRIENGKNIKTKSAVKRLYKSDNTKPIDKIYEMIRRNPDIEIMFSTALNGQPDPNLEVLDEVKIDTLK